MALTLVLSFLLWQIDPRIGMLMLVTGPVLSMIQSYRREFPLHWATILLPALVTLAGFIIQLISMSRGQVLTLLSPGILLGLFIGGLQGRGHKVVLRGTRIMAQRTRLYLVVWTVCFLLNQGAALFGQQRVIAFSMSGVGFSTAMVVGFSLVLFQRYLKGRRQFVRLKRAIQPATLFALLILSLLAAAPARLAAQDAQALAQKLLTDADLPPHYTLVNRATPEQIRSERQQGLEKMRASFAQINLPPPEDFGALATEFDHNPMANEGILTLSLVRFPNSQAAASFYNMTLSAEAGSWEGIPGCGDMAAKTMKEWTGFANSVRGPWAIIMIMQYPYSLLVEDSARIYDPEKYRQAQETARDLVMGPLTNMLQIADQRLAQLIVSGAGPSPSPGALLRLRGVRPPDPKYFRQRYGQGSLPANAAAAAAAAAILLLSAGAATGAASGIASAAADALQAAASGVGQSAADMGTRILSGDEAVSWLKDKGFVEDGHPTEKFTRWQRQSASAEGPDKDGLDAMAGEWDWGEKWGPKGQDIDLGHQDKDGNWVEPQVTIVARDGEPSPQPEPEKTVDPDTKPDEGDKTSEKDLEPPPKEEPPETPPEKEEPPPSPGEKCGDELKQMNALEETIGKISEINQRLRNEIGVLRQQRAWDKECTTACAAVDALSWTISEALFVANPWAGISVSMIQSTIVTAVKNSIKEYFQMNPGDYKKPINKVVYTKMLGEAIRKAAIDHYSWKAGLSPEQFERALPPDVAKALSERVGTFARTVINPGYIGYDFGTSVRRIEEIAKLIDTKKKLLQGNFQVLAEQRELLARAKNNYLDCASAAMEALRQYVQRQQETADWLQQQKREQRERLRRAFGS